MTQLLLQKNQSKKRFQILLRATKTITPITIPTVNIKTKTNIIIRTRTNTTQI